jgi:electron transfer flavoprotein beta subunit
MRIVVCLKQVLDLATIRVSSRGDMDMRDGVKVINPADLCALEEALKLKDAQGAQVISLALGGPEVEDCLREALAMGSDRAVLLSDPLFAGSDAHGVSYALAQAVTSIGDVDLVLAGVRSTDDGGGQVGPQVAEQLGWSQITAALGLDVADGQATACQRFEDGDRRISVHLPAVITIPGGSNQPRLAPAASIMNVYKQHNVETLTAADIAADSARLGGDGALTVVRRVFAPEAAAKGDVLSGTATEAAAALAGRLRKRGLI